jgi:hypothetical protein
MTLQLKKVLDSTYRSKDKSEDYFKRNGYDFDRNLSNINDRVYYNKNKKDLLITFRGTKNWINDLPTDYAVLTGTLNKTERYKHSKNTYDNAKQKYHKNNATLVAHSLGASIASELGSNKDKIYTYNKGAGLFHKDLKKKHETSYRHLLDPISILSINDKKTKNIGSITDSILLSHNTSQLNNKNIFL